MNFTVSASSEGRLELCIEHDLGAEAVVQALEELYPLMEAKALAVVALSKLDVGVSSNRERAMMAADLRSACSLHSALEDCKTVNLLATNAASAAEIGFPEFDDEMFD